MHRVPRTVCFHSAEFEYDPDDDADEWEDEPTQEEGYEDLSSSGLVAPGVEIVNSQGAQENAEDDIDAPGLGGSERVANWRRTNRGTRGKRTGGLEDGHATGGTGRGSAADLFATIRTGHQVRRLRNWRRRGRWHLSGRVKKACGLMALRAVHREVFEVFVELDVDTAVTAWTGDGLHAL